MADTYLEQVINHESNDYYSLLIPLIDPDELANKNSIRVNVCFILLRCFQEARPHPRIYKRAYNFIRDWKIGDIEKYPEPKCTS